MVNWLTGFLFSHPAFLLAQAKPDSPWARLDPKSRARVVAALAGMAVLCFSLVVLAWLSVRLTRRFLHLGWRSRPRPPIDDDDWASKPLYKDEASSDE